MNAKAVRRAISGFAMLLCVGGSYAQEGGYLFSGDFSVKTDWFHGNPKAIIGENTDDASFNLNGSLSISARTTDGLAKAFLDINYSGSLFSESWGAGTQLKEPSIDFTADQAYIQVDFNSILAVSAGKKRIKSIGQASLLSVADKTHNRELSGSLISQQPKGLLWLMISTIPSLSAETYLIMEDEKNFDRLDIFQYLSWEPMLLPLSVQAGIYGFKFSQIGLMGSASVQIDSLRAYGEYYYGPNEEILTPATAAAPYYQTITNIVNQFTIGLEYVDRFVRVGTEYSYADAVTLTSREDAANWFASLALMESGPRAAAVFNTYKALSLYSNRLYSWISFGSGFGWPFSVWMKGISTVAAEDPGAETVSAVLLAGVQYPVSQDLNAEIGISGVIGNPLGEFVKIKETGFSISASLSLSY